MIEITHPWLAAQYYLDKNTFPLSKLSAGSNRVIWWKCELFPDHIWGKAVFERIRKPRCPFCENVKICNSNCLATLAPKLAEEWHPNKNEDLKPTDVVPTSGKIVWWQCSNNKNHEWKAEIRARFQRGHGCPFHANQAVCEDNCVATTHPFLCEEWIDKDISPYDVVAGSAKVVEWKCRVCNFCWKARVTSRTNEGKNCSRCGDQRKSEKMAQHYIDGDFNYKNNYENGHYFSFKTNKEMFYRSSYEKNAYIILDNKTNVANYYSEALRIPYLLEGKKRMYVPDILVEYTDGTKGLIEIKPINWLRDPQRKIEIFAKMDAAIKHSKENGYRKYLIWHEKHIKKYLKSLNLI